MEVHAKIANQGKQIRIIKMGNLNSSLMSLTDAKRAYMEGRIHQNNKCFDILVEFYFDVPKTLEYYRNKSN